MLRDEIKNFCLSVSCFETRMRIWSYNLMFRDESEIFSHQSRISRREREFLLSVSCIETRISVLTLVLRDTVWGGVGWKWKWHFFERVGLNSDSFFWDFLQKHLSLYIYTDTLKSSHTHLTIKISTCSYRKMCLILPHLSNVALNWHVTHLF